MTAMTHSHTHRSKNSKASRPSRSKTDVWLFPKLGISKSSSTGRWKGNAKTATIKREGEHWYVIFACQIEMQKKLPSTDLAISMNMGLKHFMTDSNGDVVDNPRFFRTSHGKLKKKQQRLSKRRNKSHR